MQILQTIWVKQTDVQGSHNSIWHDHTFAGSNGRTPFHTVKVYDSDVEGNEGRKHYREYNLLTARARPRGPFNVRGMYVLREKADG